MNYSFFYSKETGGFYDHSEKEVYEASINGWPADAVGITDDEYNSLFDGQAAGYVIVAGDDGKPYLTAPPEPTLEETRRAMAAKKAQLLDEAYTAMKPLELAVKHDMATDEEKAQLDAWERYSVLLSRVDVDNPEWPDKPE
ncbi:tail fiber assembly protein [Serratia ureilytica]|uniref:Tail fiber assembly protein n=1 Tax=Serratia ureilytica TaxID=300181 RepID=A0A9X9C0P6_9GAMM|nr:tail fiber assembly protein [Serratia ureilytica]TXE25864.1 tail fiber assembly protein [Serratia ureilytica]